MIDEKRKLIKHQSFLPQKFYSSNTFFDMFFKLLEQRSFKIELPDFVTPYIDIHESNTSITLEIELPGMQLENFAYKIEDDLIHIRGEKRKTATLVEGAYTRTERRYGVFSRTLRLPSEVRHSQVSTFYDNGVLKIVMLKKRVTMTEAE